MPKKNILVLSSWYPTKSQPFLGNFVQRQVQLLSKEFNVFVIHTVAKDNQSDYSLEVNKNGDLTEIYSYHPSGNSIFGKRKNQKQALDSALLKVENIELLLTQILLPKGWQFVYVHRQFNVPWIHFESGSYFRKEVRKKWSILQHYIISRCKNNIDQIFTVSEFHKKDVQKVFKNKPIGVIPNHIDTELFASKEKSINSKTNFLHISTLDEATKNPKGMLDACRIVKEKTSKPFQLTIVCDDDFQKWENYSSDNKIDDEVLFVSAKNWKDLPEYYQKSNAFILNSNYESFSIVLAEALSTGTPIISTPVGIAVEIDDASCLKTEIGNADSLANRMLEIIDEKYTFNIHEIRELGLKYDSKNVLNRLSETINSTLNEK